MITKKGAMFGLASRQSRQGFSQSRAFKKQFGELFLARMQSVTPKEAHGARIQTKRGAMFGLDARIALAIFGALSVISGAALYSAIQQANTVKTLNILTEANKAIEAYLLDTGQDLPKSPAHLHVFEYRELLDSTVKGWKGPYLDIKDRDSSDPNSYWFNFRNFTNSAYFDSLRSTTWIPNQRNNCGSGLPCYYWVTLSTSIAEYDALDLYVDGEVDISNGKVRSNSRSGSYAIIHLQGPRVLNTPK